MICNHCGSFVEDSKRTCPYCGAPMPDRGVQRGAEQAAFSGFAIGKEARARRLYAVVSEDQLVDSRVYNGILTGVVLWGLLVNFALCKYVGDVFQSVHPALFLIGYFVCVIAGVTISGRSQKPLISFLGYNLVVVPLGLVIASAVSSYGGVDSRLVSDAFLYTTLIVLGITGTAIAFPNLFRKLGGALLAVLIGLLVCEVVLLLLRVRQEVTDWIAAGLFSLYIGYDIYRSQQFPKTVDNAVDCALDIYMDIANLFLRILSILSSNKKNKV